MASLRTGLHVYGHFSGRVPVWAPQLQQSAAAEQLSTPVRQWLPVPRCGWSISHTDRLIKGLTFIKVLRYLVDGQSFMLSLSTDCVLSESCAHSSSTRAHLVRPAMRNLPGDDHVASGGMWIYDPATQLGYFPELKPIHFKRPNCRGSRDQGRERGEALPLALLRSQRARRFDSLL